MKSITLTLAEYKLVPVVTLDEPQKANLLADAFKTNGLPLIEVTLRTDAALESIRRIRESHPDMRIGAGTVLKVDQVRAAREAGADFIVSPGFNPAIVDHCTDRNIPIVPGVDSPTLIEAALERGIQLVKFFPAQVSGGVEYLKAAAAPYNEIQFMPTGGINPGNILNYLALKKVVACGGSWLAPRELLAGDDFDEIGRRTREALGLIRENTRA